MKTSALTIRLEPALEHQLAQIACLNDRRRRIMPLAEARGHLSGEAVLRDVS